MTRKQRMAVLKRNRPLTDAWRLEQWKKAMEPMMKTMVDYYLERSTLSDHFWKAYEAGVHKALRETLDSGQAKP